VFVDPAISRKKFDREIEQFRAQHMLYHPRGVWLVRAEFPEAIFMFTAVNMRHPTVAFGAIFNFENYDVEPLSVALVHPVTLQRLKKRDLPHDFATQVQQVMVGPNQFGWHRDAPLAVAFDEDREPFICLRGVREYHEHPAHDGDSWWLHRRGGTGTLSHLLEQLAKYGIDGLRGVQVQLAPVIGPFAPPIPA
jgi:hypothetical protein